MLSPVSTTWVHGPSSRAEFTARELGCIFDTRQLGPSTRVVETDLNASDGVSNCAYVAYTI